MPVDESYRKQVSLLVKIAPLVAKETVFALKGGTAINLFLRNMPRLSVDIDLTYLPVKDRASSLKEIDAAMRRIANDIERSVPSAKVSASAPKGEKTITKLIVRADAAQIKIEVTPFYAAASTNPRSSRYRSASRRNSASLRCKPSALPTSMAARSLLPSTANWHQLEWDGGATPFSFWDL